MPTKHSTPQSSVNRNPFSAAPNLLQIWQQFGPLYTGTPNKTKMTFVSKNLFCGGSVIFDGSTSAAPWASWVTLRVRVRRNIVDQVCKLQTQWTLSVHFIVSWSFMIGNRRNPIWCWRFIFISVLTSSPALIGNTSWVKLLYRTHIIPISVALMLRRALDKWSLWVPRTNQLLSTVLIAGGV